MLRPLKQLRADRRKLAIPIAAIAGVATAALVAVAVAKTSTLQVAKNAKVTNTAGMTSSESIVINTRGHAVYELSGDSKSHPKCTNANGCFQFWPPVTVSAAKTLSAASGIKGRLGVWQRSGLDQVTLRGHPLYTFAEDRQTHIATGEGLKSFHGTWHVIKASATTGGTSSTSTTTASSTTGTTTSSTTGTTTSSTTSTTTTTCLYPPCY
jgi:predicted lipoprotein with Yx(FWY)xxD motif